MLIGKRIYYDAFTGNVLAEVPERQGSVIETTSEEDFASYSGLKDRTPESVGCIQLEYGQYSEEFSNSYGFRVNVEDKSFEFNTIPPEAPIEDKIKQKLLELKQAFDADLVNGFKSNCTGTMKEYPYTSDDKSRMMGILTMQNAGINFPITWGAKGESFGPYTLDQFKKLCFDGAVAEQTKLVKLSTLVEQAKECTTDEDLNNIIW